MVMEDSFHGLIKLSSEWYPNAVRKGSRGKVADVFIDTERPRAIYRRHLQESFGQDGRMILREQTHFCEHIQLNGLPPDLVNARQAVSSKTNIYSMLGEFLKRKRSMLKVMVT